MDAPITALLNENNDLQFFKRIGHLRTIKKVCFAI